eukprot:m.151013 g.151013  ORF g.151013 m.151013 type:complete len:97 (+) comp11692_c0_seq4:626-916(+)
MSQLTAVNNDGTVPQHALPAQSEHGVTPAPVNPEVGPQLNREPDDDNRYKLFKAKLVIAKGTPTYYMPNHAVREVVAWFEPLCTHGKEGAYEHGTK